MRETLRIIEQMLKGSDREAKAAARQLAELEEATELLSAVGQELGIELVLRKDGREIAHAVALPGTSGVRFENITPARYQLLLSTGRELWEQELNTEDVLFSLSFPKEPLPAAAKTDELPPVPSLEVTVASGALKISLFPGRESGTLRCQYRPDA